MKRWIGFIATLACLPLCAEEPATTRQANAQPALHRYIVERTFPRDALKGVNAETKKQVNANNARVGVKWILSYANAAETKTYCLYEGPSEAAVRKAAQLNKLPIDKVTEVPVTLTPQ